MAITESQLIDRIEVLSSGVVQVRQADVIAKDGAELARSYRRRTLAPGDAIAGEDAAVQAVCAAVWTPAVVEAYRAALAAAGQS